MTLRRYFTLHAADREEVGRCRGAANTLGFAVQLCTLRRRGHFLRDMAGVPPAALEAVAEQVGLLPLALVASLQGYPASEDTRLDHHERLRRHLGFSRCGAVERQRLLDHMTATARSVPRAATLYPLACRWLLEQRVVRPGASTVRDLLARAREQALAATFEALASNLTPDAREQLDQLLSLPISADGSAASTRSRLDGFQLPAPGVSAAALVTLMARLDDMRGLGFAQWPALRVVHPAMRRLLAGWGVRPRRLEPAALRSRKAARHSGLHAGSGCCRGDGRPRRDAGQACHPGPQPRQEAQGRPVAGHRCGQGPGRVGAGEPRHARAGRAGRARCRAARPHLCTPLPGGNRPAGRGLPGIARGRSGFAPRLRQPLVCRHAPTFAGPAEVCAPALPARLRAGPRGRASAPGQPGRAAQAWRRCPHRLPAPAMAPPCPATVRAAPRRAGDLAAALRGGAAVHAQRADQERRRDRRGVAPLGRVRRLPDPASSVGSRAAGPLRCPWAAHRARQVRGRARRRTQGGDGRGRGPARRQRGSHHRRAAGPVQAGQGQTGCRRGRGSVAPGRRNPVRQADPSPPAEGRPPRRADRRGQRNRLRAPPARHGGPGRAGSRDQTPQRAGRAAGLRLQPRTRAHGRRDAWHQRPTRSPRPRTGC